MLFNKKPDEEFSHDFSSKRQSIATYSVDPAPIAPRKVTARRPVPSSTHG